MWCIEPHFSLFFDYLARFLKTNELGMKNGQVFVHKNKILLKIMQFPITKLEHPSIPFISCLEKRRENFEWYVAGLAVQEIKWEVKNNEKKDV